MIYSSFNFKKRLNKDRSLQQSYLFNLIYFLSPEYDLVDRLYFGDMIPHYFEGPNLEIKQVKSLNFYSTPINFMKRMLKSNPQVENLKVESMSFKPFVSSLKKRNSKLYGLV